MSILENSKIKNNSILKTTVCIIGSGISAQLIASKINNAEIIMIDSGKIKYDQKIQSLNQIEEVGLPFRKNYNNRVRQLGGSANLWANQFMTLKEKLVAPRDWVAKDFSFPLEYYSFLELYKEAIETVYNNKFKNFNYLDPQKENYKNLFLEKEFLKTNIFEMYDHFWPSKVEKFNSKSDFTKKIINLKNLKFIENFTATEINMNNEKQFIETIKIQSETKACEIKANFFILACGAIENARLLLNNEKKSKILQNPNTGRYFMDHPRISFGEIKSNNRLPLSNLLGIKYINYDFRKSIKLSDTYQMKKKILDGYAFLDPKYEKNDEKNFELFLNEIKTLLKFKGFPEIKKTFFNYKANFEQVYLKLSPQISNSYLNSLLRNFFDNKKYFFSFNKMNINYQSEQYPNYQSRIYLSQNKDYFNQNKLIIDWKLSDIDYKTYDEFVMAFRDKINLVPSLEFKESIEKNITDASHHSGTTRMSKNRSDGVVDTNCKFHDIHNLFISGNSILRAAGSVNPGLTNMAMSIKLARYINKLL